MVDYGKLYYRYKLKIDLEELIDKIIEKLDAGYDDWYFEDSKLVIEGTDKCGYKSWHCDATLESPAEDEIDLIDSIDDKNIEKVVLDAVSDYKEWLLKTNKCVAECEIDEDFYEYLPDEPDADAIYDAYRDRMLEE